MNTSLDILKRMIAVVIASALGTIGAGSILGVDVWKGALLASIMGVAVVSEALARDFLKDGSLSKDEINAAFAKANDQAEEISANAIKTVESFRAAEDVSVDSNDHADAQAAEEVEGH